MPLPHDARSSPVDLRELPGGVSNSTHGEGTRRGVGFAVGFKNIAFAEGFDDYSTARVRLSLDGDGPLVEIHSAAAEVGQGLVTVMEQIARTELDVERVRVLPADTAVGSAGSTLGVAPDLDERRGRADGVPPGGPAAARAGGRDRRAARDPPGRRADRRDRASTATGRPSRWTPRPGRATPIVASRFAAHRAVCDVDVELGLVRAVEIATTQDVGRIMNPLALEGQIQGGIAQGLGLALMEEIQMRDGRVQNASFTDYLMPTVLDMPPVRMSISETPHPHAPYGLNGVGEMPTIASTPALVAAVRDATGRELPRVPLRPADIAGVG